jgi:hypothetical protein
MRAHKVAIAAIFTISSGFAVGVSGQALFPGQPLKGKVIHLVTPSTAEPGLKTSEDEENVVVIPEGNPRTELFVWLPGTNGHPKGDSAILNTAAAGGYRVIGLQYNNHMTAETVCKDHEGPECYTKFREERFLGDVQDAPIPNTPSEGVEHRLVMLLKYLSKSFPDEGWSAYLEGDQPRWNKIVLAGHSQGAGEAAFIAKKRELARVILFSGAADGTGDSIATRRWASWLTAASKTPMDRWFAEYNVQEKLALAEPMAYVDVLKVPKDHVRVFKLDLPATDHVPLAAHMSVVHDVRYLPEWRWMMGLDAKPIDK